MVRWNEIDTVLLDMDGTLLDLNFDNFFWQSHLPVKYAEHHGVPVEHAHNTLETLSDSVQGHLNWYCLDYWSDMLKMDIAALKTEVSHLIQFRPHTVDFLSFLSDLDKHTMLVTNAHPTALKIKLQASGLDQHISKHISSHELKLAKENAGFWPELGKQHNLNLARCLFIDDSVAVLNRARSEGIGQAIQVLQPDMQQAARPASDFPGIVHFTEIMN